MLTTFFVVLPIFALIFVGFGCRRLDVLGPHSTTELNRFVVYLALPALLFDIMAHTSWKRLDQPAFTADFALSCFIVYALTILLRLRGPRHLADVSIDGLNAGYGNTGFIGFPLSLIVFGRGSLGLTTIAAIITVCLLFAVAIIIIEIGLQTEVRPAHLLLKVGRSLIRNPLLVAPVLGSAWAATSIAMPTSAETFLHLLGDAASPCALVALGLFLGERRGAPAGESAVGNAPAEGLSGTVLLVALKLILQPVLAWVLATQVFRLAPGLTHLVVVLAALPTGTGPFMLAEFYNREATVTARSILFSTIGSLVTVSAYLAWVK